MVSKSDSGKFVLLAIVTNQIGAERMKKLLSSIVVLAMLTLSFSSISSAATIPDWKTLYNNQIVKLGIDLDWYGDEYFSLVDFNMDGVPELIIGRSNKKVQGIIGAYTIIDNKVVKLTIFEDGVKAITNNEGYGTREMSALLANKGFGGLSLYKHKITGQYMYIGDGRGRGTTGSSVNIYAIELFGKSLYTNKLGSIDVGNKTAYYWKGKEVSKQKYDEFLKSYLSEYKEVSGGVYSTQFNENGTFGSEWGSKGKKSYFEFMSTFDYPETFIANLSPSKWAVTAVEDASKLKLIPLELDRGYQNAISREDFSKLAIEYLTVYFQVSRGDILLTLKISDVDLNPFTDTSASDVILAYNIGIVTGKGEKLFDPEGSITRQEAAVMLERIAKLTGKKSFETSIAFKDKAQIASWARYSVTYVAGLTDKNSGSPVMGSTGDNQFNPKGTYSREQAFITMVRLIGS